MPSKSAKIIPPRADEMKSALATLRRSGGPVEIKRRGKTVAVVMTPEELEAMEDQIDAAILQEDLRNPDREPLLSFEEVAASWGVDLTALERDE